MSWQVVVGNGVIKKRPNSVGTGWSWVDMMMKRKAKLKKKGFDVISR